jgi:hypothetical protein
MAGTHQPTTDREVTMSKPELHHAIEVRFDLRPGWVTGKSSATVLSALGHPGYGEVYSRKVLARVIDTGCSTHEAVYGRGVTV